MGKGKYGLKIKIPEIFETKETSNMEIKVNGEIIKGRPKVVLKQFLELGFERNWFNPTLIRFLIAWGFKRKYWTDWDFFVEDLRHFVSDTYGDKVLEEIENDG